jgi:hypothetical protein
MYLSKKSPLTREAIFQYESIRGRDDARHRLIFETPLQFLLVYANHNSNEFYNYLGYG